ncbi:hypothetical protein LEMLEM_LOCUS14797, partial [Lemmus lemmus]
SRLVAPRGLRPNAVFPTPRRGPSKPKCLRTGCSALLISMEGRPRWGPGRAREDTEIQP